MSLFGYLKRIMVSCCVVVGAGAGCDQLMAQPLIERAGPGLEQILPAMEADEKVINALATLAPNHAVDLGNARVSGDFNEVARRFDLQRTGPRSRDYSIKMVWAPERKRALFVGANHGQPHRLNDVWEFDLTALSWILLYPPDNPRSYLGLGVDASDVVFSEGVLKTRQGGPAVIGHTWWGLAYHPGLRRMLWMNIWSPDKSKLVAGLGGDPAELYKGPPLWSFDPQQRNWAMLRSEGLPARVAFAGMLEYVDSIDNVVWHANNWQMRGTWRFDSTTSQWHELDGKKKDQAFGARAPGVEQVAYYDPRRDLLIAQRKTATFHFDVKEGVWRKARTEPEDSDEVPNGHDARTPFVYDSVTGKGLLIDLRSGQIWAYDPDTQEWSRRTPKGPAMPMGKKRLAYFDHHHGVLVVIDGRRIWAYRNSSGG